MVTEKKKKKQKEAHINLKRNQWLVLYVNVVGAKISVVVFLFAIFQLSAALDLAITTNSECTIPVELLCG